MNTETMPIRASMDSWKLLKEKQESTPSSKRLSYRQMVDEAIYQYVKGAKK